MTTRITIDPEACQRCRHFACICYLLDTHNPNCPHRIAATCAAPIACEHGRDVCLTCDPCTCHAPPAED
jgi:hypothetical protein